MEAQIEKEIEHQAKKLLRRKKIDAWIKNKFQKRYQKRGLIPVIKPNKDPLQWKLHPHFNPTYCIKHSKYLAKIIWKKLQEGSYKPQPALQFEIPKPTGGTRSIMIFSIPDASIAGMFHRRLTKRNANIFSSNNYSYRYDCNVFDAIINMKSALEGNNNFIVQYDFKEYFDTISHSYINDLVDNKDLFLISIVEKNVIKAFLSHQYATRDQYALGNYESRIVGVPQGSSISLFLSNIAGHELDKDLEKHGGQFVRFADDVVAVTYTYSDALSVGEVFSKHCIRSGTKINRAKSPGIYLLDNFSDREIRQKDDFDYLGHKFKQNDVLLADRSIVRIKQRISNIIYIHLIQTPRDSNRFNQDRIGTPFRDWDLVTCINEIRRYVYGGLKHEHLTKFILDNVRLSRMRGLMSFYPLVTSCEQLVQLDGWLLNVLERAYNQRRKALSSMGYSLDSIVKTEFISGTWHVSPDSTISNETECPSFVYAWRAARKYYIRFGLSGIAEPGYYSDDSGGY